MDAININKQDLNKIVMNYLLVEGYQSAAEKFTQECGIKADMEYTLIGKRREIRVNIQKGKIVEAVELINDINPEILDNDDELYFNLKKQKLIELIKENKPKEAIEFSQGALAEKAMNNPVFLDQIEEVMALLAFENLSECPLKKLIDISERQKLASQVNEAILVSQ